MIRSSTRLRLCAVLICVNLAFIWGNSLLPGHISGAMSDWAKAGLDQILSWVSPQTRPHGPGGGLLRKLAHLTEFTCLGMLLRWLVGMLRDGKWEQLLYPLAGGMLAAGIDETIQCFVPDRGPAIKDVGIDTLGVLLGIVIISLIQIFKNKKSRYLEETQL